MIQEHVLLTLRKLSRNGTLYVGNGVDHFNFKIQHLNYCAMHVNVVIEMLFGPLGVCH